MLGLITDRTQEHVYLLQRLHKKGWADMSPSERTLWSTDATKGAYNHTDLNRVENAVSKLAFLMGLDLTIKTDWSQWDTVTQADMERYLGNVVIIRDMLADEIDFPPLPSSMSNLTWEGANNIEKVLDMAFRTVSAKSVLSQFVLGEDELA